VAAEDYNFDGTKLICGKTITNIKTAVAGGTTEPSIEKLAEVSGKNDGVSITFADDETVTNLAYTGKSFIATFDVTSWTTAKKINGQ